MKRCARCDHEYDDAYDSCPECARRIPTSNTMPPKVQDDIETRVSEIERLLNASDVYHFDFWPRAWAILGHNMSAGIIIYGIVLALTALLVLSFGPPS